MKQQKKEMKQEGKCNREVHTDSNLDPEKDDSEEIKFFDLIEDPIYLYVKAQLNVGRVEVVGGRIVVPKIVGPHAARKLLQVQLKDRQSNQKVVKAFNYNRLWRQLSQNVNRG